MGGAEDIQNEHAYIFSRAVYIHTSFGGGAKLGRDIDRTSKFSFITAGLAL